MQNNKGSKSKKKAIKKELHKKNNKNEEQQQKDTENQTLKEGFVDLVSEAEDMNVEYSDDVIPKKDKSPSKSQLSKDQKQ